MTQTKPNRPVLSTLRAVVVVILLLLLYAFAVEQTNINLEEPLEPRRQGNVLNVLRQLANPDFFDRDDDGSLLLSETGQITLRYILETILMALLASTIGTLLAVPFSFLAARNLMADVSAPLASVMAAVIALPIGAAAGWLVARALLELSADLSEQAVMGVGALVLAIALTWPVLRLGPPVVSEERQPAALATFSLLRIVAAILLFVFSLGVLAQLGIVAGPWLAQRLGPVAFLGNFIYVLADFTRLILPGLVGLVAGMVAASLGGRIGQEAVLRLQGIPAKLLTALLTALGTAVIILAIGGFLYWLYEFENRQDWTVIPAAIGGVAAGLLSLLLPAKRPMPVGFTIYTISRTFLNALRSIEPLILGIVFVVWVSLGPFAGVMALTLHSIAALGKLFSEQVEGIAAGPLEAITATGANRMQTIVYAVIPQVIPPFVAFSLYRWDINVRMSTIIGFVGGGGIGLVLSQNIQQNRYAQASVMLIAIAIVVSTLDYLSARIRTRII
jgi:phosphonate ABC transporter permease subunit PhnE